MPRGKPRHARGTGETPVPVDPRLLERVLRSLEEEAQLDADIAHAERKLKLDTVTWRLR